jgi:hypothetical protein
MGRLLNTYGDFMLPASVRRWSPAAVPGTYPIEPELVTEIRERYL